MLVSVLGALRRKIIIICVATFIEIVFIIFFCTTIGCGFTIFTSTLCPILFDIGFTRLDS
jgi:C4-dicarboxylate transporter